MEIFLSRLTCLPFTAKKSNEGFILLYRNAAIETQSLYTETHSVQRLMHNKTWHQEFVLPTPWLSKAPTLHERMHFIFLSLKVEIKISLLLHL